MRTKSKLSIFSIFLAAMLVFGLGQAVNATLTAVSPTNDPVNGFPLWYQDAGGLQLQLCTDAANCFNPPPFDPVLGVGPETFYFTADATIPVAAGGALPVGGNADIRMAVEAAFGNAAGTPVAGDQVTFARARIRIDVPVAGTYTVTHPFGVETFQVATPGLRAITDRNFQGGAGAPLTNTTHPTIPLGDIGCVLAEPPLPPAPCDFTVTLTGLVGPFVRWDPAIAPAAPAGFLGNFNIPHEIIGAVAPGQNFFQVTGPAGSNLGGPGVDTIKTTLFTVMGQVFAAPLPQTTGATFSRNPVGAGTIEVLAVGLLVTPTTIDAIGLPTPLPGEPIGGFPLTPIGTTGNWSVTPAIPIVAADVLPDTVTLTLDAGLATVSTMPNIPVTDKIVGNAGALAPSAIFDAVTGVLSVTAACSNQSAPLPTLTVTNGAVALGTIPATGGTLAVPMAAAPASVTITSAAAPAAADPAGGTAVIAVTTLGAPAGPVPPGGGGAVPVGGGGGGGGCFIETLF